MSIANKFLKSPDSLTAGPPSRFFNSPAERESSHFDNKTDMFGFREMAGKHLRANHPSAVRPLPRAYNYSRVTLKQLLPIVPRYPVLPTEGDLALPNH